MPFLTAGGHRLEYEHLPGKHGAPTLVLLHEGLGSLAMWRDFPATLAQATDCPLVVYSRYGYGGSDPLTAPRTPRYMHDEALVALPELRQALGLDDVVLVGHSDGASVALIHAGSGRWPVRALILEAPHVFTEDMGIAAVAEARVAYDTGDLRQRLARHHGDVDGAFRGWCVACPVLAIQGADDQYGTSAQLDAIERGVIGSFERLVLADCRHSPHRDQASAVLAAMSAFVARV
jgi:pimeloyl-ACP methyl ester carboxylesterase